MSIRRSSSRYSQRSSGRDHESVDHVENPNAYGLWGTYREAPRIAEVTEYDEQRHLNENMSPEIQGNPAGPGWHTVEVHGGYDPAVHHDHHSHRPQGHQNDQQVPQAGMTGNENIQHSNRHHHDQQQQQIYHQHQGQQHQHQQQQHSQHAQPGHALGISSADVYAHSLASMSEVQVGNTHDAGGAQYAAETPLVSHLRKNDPSRPPGLQRQTSFKGSEAAASAFDAVHGGSNKRMAQHGEQIPIRIGHLFKRPLIRQWVLQDKVYREVDDREASQFELFFDLVMVGIIHKLADGAAEEATGLNVAKFILCFYPAWSVWSDVRSYINVSGTDDVWQRIYILLIMILLMGYAANASGIVIEKQHATVSASNASEAFQQHGEHAKRMAQFTAGAVGTMFWKRSGGESNKPPPELVEQIGKSGFWFASGWHEAIASAIGFYLVAKLCRLALFVIYGALLPKFRKALWLNGIALGIIAAVYLPIMFIKSPGIIVLIIAIGVVAELGMRYLVAAALQMMHGHAKHKGHKTYMPAYSLPHMMERTTLFSILVIGETIMNATYVAEEGQYGAHDMFWRATLAIVIAFLLMWIYFDVDSSRTFVHGLKRHWFTSITYTHLHFPLSAALVLMSSSLVVLIKNNHVEQDYLWFFSGSIAMSMFCMGILGLMHKSLDKWGSSLIPKSARIGVRFVLSALFCIMPKLKHWNGDEFLGAHAAMLALAVAFETFGKLGAVGRTYDPVRASELHQLRLSNKGFTQSSSMGEEGGAGIPMASLSSGSTMAEKASPSSRHSRRFSVSGALDAGMRKIHKDSRVKGPGKRESWHEYDDLTGAERGEEDVGIESELGKIESKEVSSGQRWAYVAA